MNHNRRSRRRSVPKVIWRLFYDRARSLAHTLAFLLPPHSSSSSPSRCRFCHGRRCLSCARPYAMSFLLQHSDPADYRDLLRQCFVVVSQDAPPLTRFSAHSHCSQVQIVRAVIETTTSMSKNIISDGYNKLDKSSTIVELLTSSAWCLLLERVGDGIMVYLLQNALIFLPIPGKKHQQVTGFPISGLCYKSSKRTPDSQCQPPLPVPCGKKRKRDDNFQTMLPNASSSGTGESITSATCNGWCNYNDYNITTNSYIGFSEASTPTTSTITIDHEGKWNQELTRSSEKLRKRPRPFRWQRCRKRRQLPSQGTSVMGPLKTTITDNQRPPGRLSCCLKPCLGHHGKKCSCLRFRIPQMVAKEAEINRKCMFYNLEHSSTLFPRNHVLNLLKSGSASSEFLVRSIFGICVTESAHSKTCPDGSGLCPEGSACLYHSLVKLLKIIIRRSQYVQHLTLLDKHCVVGSLNQDTSNSCGCIFEGEKLDSLQKCHFHTADHCNQSPEVTDSRSEEIKSYCFKSQVESFIWAVCRSIIPSELLGTPSNWRILRRTISKFIHLRRYEKFSLKQCMHKLKASRFPFFSHKQFYCCMDNLVVKNVQGQSLCVQEGSCILADAVHIVKVKLLESWIFWFFSSLVMPLLQANFYVTESDRGKQDVYYYRKSVWEKVKNKTIISCMNDQGYRYLDDATTRKILSKRSRSFGFSKLRICPKECGVRLLANLKARSKMPQKRFFLAGKSTGIRRQTTMHEKKVSFESFNGVNAALRDTHAVLKAIQLKEPGKLGSSVFDYNDVYRKLCPFIIGLKNGLTMTPDAFIIVSDVSKAFDSIIQDKLLSILKGVIRADKYYLQKSWHVVPTKGSLRRVHDNLAFLDRNTISRSKCYISSVSLRSVLVNQVCSRSMMKTELLSNLKEHVKRNVLQLDKNFYLQRVGISQGSVLSSLLCSLYYGHLDKNVIVPFLEKTWEPAAIYPSRGYDFQDASAAQSSSEDIIASSSRYIILRYIDDFLFISTSKKQAASFFSRLQRGFRDYNCHMNKKKFCVNFDVGNAGLPSNRVLSGEDGILFLRWCGLLINSRTLEVQADYTKCLNNHLSSSLTVLCHGKPVRHFKGKLRDFMRANCHALFFDSNINSASVVRLNIYQAFLLCAMKFHCYVCDLSYICKLDSTIYTKIIRRSFRYMYKLINKRMRSLDSGSDFHPILQLKEEEVEWLGLFAYIQILKRKQSRYRKLLTLLKSRLFNHKITSSVASELNYAVDRSHSSLLWKIKY